MLSVFQLLAIYPGANQQLFDVAGRNVVGFNAQYIITIFQVEIPLRDCRNLGK